MLNLAEQNFKFSKRIPKVKKIQESSKISNQNKYIRNYQ